MGRSQGDRLNSLSRQRLLFRAVRTRASYAVINSRYLSRHWRMRSSPRGDTVRPPPSRRKEHGFTIGGGRSAARTSTRGDHATSTANTIDQSDPDDDEQDA